MIALAVALTLAVWVASRITTRLDRIVAFARRIAAGEPNARLRLRRRRSLSSIEAALDQSRPAARAELCRDRKPPPGAGRHARFHAGGGGRHHPEGLVRWSNAAMQRIAGTQIRTGRPLVHSVRDPELLACVKGGAGAAARSALAAPARWLPGRIFEINAAPMPSGGALAVLHDVTRIEAAEKSRREFVANVSHELRTPLTSIQGYVETLVEDPTPSGNHARISRHHSQKRHPHEPPYRGSAGPGQRGKPELQAISAAHAGHTLVQDAIDSLGGMVVDSGIALEFTGAPEALVLADPGRDESGLWQPG